MIQCTPAQPHGCVCGLRDLSCQAHLAGMACLDIANPTGKFRAAEWDTVGLKPALVVFEPQEQVGPCRAVANTGDCVSSASALINTPSVPALLSRLSVRRARGSHVIERRSVHRHASSGVSVTERTNESPISASGEQLSSQVLRHRSAVKSLSDLRSERASSP